MNQRILDFHHGIRFEVEAVPCNGAFEGRFTLLDFAAVSGSAGPPEKRWATETQALEHATEAAQQAIERMLPNHYGRQRGR